MARPVLDASRSGRCRVKGLAAEWNNRDNMGSSLHRWCRKSEDDGCSLKPKWRNGRRAGLKIRFTQVSVGSSPTFGSKDLRQIVEVCS
jgi:hypothetical protein